MKQKIKLITYLFFTFFIFIIIIFEGIFLFKNDNKTDFIKVNLTEYVNLHKNDNNLIGETFINEYYGWITEDISEETSEEHGLEYINNFETIENNINKKVFVIPEGEVLEINPDNDLFITDSIFIGEVNIKESIYSININNSLITNISGIDNKTNIYNSIVYSYNSYNSYNGETKNSLIGNRYKEKGESIYINQYIEPSYWDKKII